MTEFRQRTQVEKCAIVALRDKEIPSRLLEINKPVNKLYYIGNLPDPMKPSVAIVGARKCTKYGETMAAWFASELAKEDVQIISGMAKGIDGVAQMAAINAGGKSYGILGCGVDVCYPFENRKLYDLLKENGGLISEYAPGCKARPEHFPMRNRIISALADVILVIEAKQKSGTLITVDYGLEQGKEIFALPGNLDNPFSVGCNVLIQQGANIALSPDNILDCIHGMVREDGRSYEKRKKSDFKLVTDALKNISQYSDYNPNTIPVEVSEKEYIIIRAIGESTVSFQQLYERIIDTGLEMSVHELMNHMMKVRVKGVVKQTKSNLYYIAKDVYPVVQFDKKKGEDL